MLRLCVVLGFTLALAVPTAATVIVPAEFSEMVRESQVIVHGTIVDVRSQLVGTRRTIETIVTIAVADPIKGTPGATVVFRVPGGQVGRYRRVMVGAPEFDEGEEVVLFLAGRAPAVPMPFGLSQGVYRVSRTGARATVAPMTEGAVVRGDPARRPLAVDEFAATVRGIVERQR